MKKFLFFTFLIAFFGSNGHAEWKKISEYRGVTLYVEIDTISNKNGYVYFWDDA